MTNLTLISNSARMNAKIRINDQFRHYKPEQEKGIRNLKVNRNKELECIKRIFSEYMTNYSEHGEYEIAIKMLIDNKVRCTQNNINELLIGLNGLVSRKIDESDWAAGEFISAMIDLSESNEISISTKHLEFEIYSLCDCNRKKVVICGDAGHDLGGGMVGGEILVKGNAGGLVGNGMKGGKITIKGNAEDETGIDMDGGNILIEGNVDSELGTRMVGGSITIEGNAGNNIGGGMAGGRITIEGNAGNNIGESMAGGVIFLKGDYGHLSDKIDGGFIYHKEKIIVDGGKIL